MTCRKLDVKLLQGFLDRMDRQINQLNSSILEHEKRIVILAQTLTLVNDVLMLEEALPFSRDEGTFVDMRRHLQFVDYYSDRENFEMTLQNAIDLLHDFRVIQSRIQQYLRAVKEGSEEVKKASKALTIEDVINVVTNKLRSIIRETPKHEREIQDAMETLFQIKEYEFEREKVAFEYSTCARASNVKDASTLIEAGFEYITDMNDVKLFRKRK